MTEVSSQGLVLYTASFGDYENLRACSPDPERFPLVCFTDRPDQIPDDAIAKPSMAQHPINDPRLLARWHKIMASRDLTTPGDLSVWIDANVEFVSQDAFESVVRWFRQSTSEIATWAHPIRDTWRQELAAALERGGGTTADAARRQKAEYERRGLMAVEGLFSTCVILRRHRSDQLRLMEDIWWADVSTLTPRDQVSLPAAAAMADCWPEPLPTPFDTTPTPIGKVLRRSRVALKIAGKLGLSGRHATSEYHENALVRVWRH